MFLFLLLSPGILYPAPKNTSTGLAFLKLGIGARAIAMGEAYSALSTDASGLYYNPAGIALGNENEVTVMHKQWIFGTATEYLAGTFHDRALAFGISLNSTNIDGIELRQQPGPSEGTFGLHDFAVSGTASWRVDSSLSVGASAKLLYEKIFVNESNGVAFDFGACYKIDGFGFAVALANLGSMSKLINDPITLPAGIRVGASFENSLTTEFALTFSGDGIRVFKDEGFRLHLGCEVLYRSVLAVRSGYQVGYEAKGVSGGIGVRYAYVQFDYAYVPMSDQLGNAHTFGLTFNL